MSPLVEALQLGLGLLAGPVELPTERLVVAGWLDAALAYPPIKALLPIPILAALAPVVIWFFKKTWQRLDAEARASWGSPKADSDYASGTESRVSLSELPTIPENPAPEELPTLVQSDAPRPSEPTSLSASAVPHDYRPAACLVIVAIVLTLQEYYGGRTFFAQVLKPWLFQLEAAGQTWLQVRKYEDLWGYGWWAFSRIGGYVAPLFLWKLLFPKDSLLDMGLRVRGFFSHAWIYGLCLVVVLPSMYVVASQPDFGSYYPFYKLSSRSWFDFLLWEAIYFAQFFALELFFRGWMLGALRKNLGAAAIFVMAVPYCMIHYGKPYLEAHGAIVAGIVLGSLAMHTRSIYAGFLVHVTVAFLMDFLALYKRSGLPTAWFPN
jgi:membrane protease YdiL (CAAX protease family)